MNIGILDYNDRKKENKFRQTLRETGFAILRNAPISKQLLDTVYADWKQFFNSESKFDYLFSEDTQDGYFPFQSENAKNYSAKDLKEFFHIYETTPLPAMIGEKTSLLRKQLISLGAELLDILHEQTDREIKKEFSMPLHQMAEHSSSTLFRIIHYPPLKEEYLKDEVVMRAQAHEDINLITLLPMSTARGLEVQDVERVWHPVICEPHDIVINSGDMLSLLSNNYYKSTTHRVVNPKGEEAKQSRYSMPLFMHPRGDVLLTPQKTAQEFLDERLKEIGLKK